MKILFILFTFILSGEILVLAEENQRSNYSADEEKLGRYYLEVICKTECRHMMFFNSEYQALRNKSCLMQDPNIRNVLGPICCDSKSEIKVTTAQKQFYGQNVSTPREVIHAMDVTVLATYPDEAISKAKSHVRSLGHNPMEAKILSGNAILKLYRVQVTCWCSHN